MRLFVALDLSDETRAQVRAVRDALEARIARVRRPPRVTWVAEASAHVTVRFIGEVAEEVAPRVRAALADGLTVPPYAMRFAGLGAFPSLRRPRALWIGSETGGADTARVVQEVNARLNSIVGPGEARDFRAHLTVARVKEPAPFDWEAAIAAVRIPPTTTFIDHVTLYRSTTSPKGPTYTALWVTPLGHSGAR